MTITYQYKIPYVTTLLNNGVNEVQSIVFTVNAVDDTDNIAVSWTSECKVELSEIPVEYNTLSKSDLIALIKEVIGIQQIKSKIKKAFSDARTPQPTKRNFPWV